MIGFIIGVMTGILIGSGLILISIKLFYPYIFDMLESRIKNNLK